MLTVLEAWGLRAMPQGTSRALPLDFSRLGVRINTKWLWRWSFLKGKIWVGYAERWEMGARTTIARNVFIWPRDSSHYFFYNYFHDRRCVCHKRYDDIGDIWVIKIAMVMFMFAT